MKLHLKLATALALVLTSPIIPIKSSFAQVPIREIQQTQGLTISGVVTAVFGNKFVIDDGTGQILVETGPPWYHQIQINQGEAVTVVGEYDDNDFDAFTITRQDGTVLNIRPASGPPPWAGGPERRANRQGDFPPINSVSR
ncbi:DNA-binding protein [Limnoraphis robusta Tam1]|uniref:DNA-binding protein n=1 Tax=Limnoraphis robusta TaxID=1118279 RepID=UPI002B20ADC7|nr:DNA-binding protein [Limnoraphis robusta]MEA5537899.1 DNA-binding protein [Limnoraphis robusta Tam1]